MKKVVAIIPARSGSKTVKDKNIRIMNGKPMLAYSIEQALLSEKIDRVIVSTDSLEYKRIAEEYGAEVPFLRPPEISGDTSLDIEVFEHALNWLKTEEHYNADICVHLRPTHPIRDYRDIDKMVEIMEDDETVDAVRSVSPAKQTPYKMWLFQESGSNRIRPLAECEVAEAYNAPRQKLPIVYMQNACIDVIRGRIILDKHSMTGDNIIGYKMNYDFDVDTEEDFLNAEKMQLLINSAASKAALKICCDIDGVIASKTPGNDYNLAKPKRENIEIINSLYEKGCHIVLFTARGYQTGLDWIETTKRQMKEWGVRYHALLFGKPDADIYIDDKFYELNSLKIFYEKEKFENEQQI